MSARRVLGVTVAGVAFASLAASQHQVAHARKPVTTQRPVTEVARVEQRLPAPLKRCRLAEPELAELSGMAADDESWYAVSDGGSSLRVFVLNPQDCSVRDVRTAPVDPYDVEDLALGGDGALWLADTGDNSHRRDTIALHRLGPEGGSTLYRLRYPDRPHDAEAMVLDRSGKPYFITKEPFGGAQFYQPSAPLEPGGTTPLRNAGSLALPGTETRGGPFSGGFGSALVTGAAMNHAGTVVAVRTYTDAYLFSAPDGDVVRALRGKPLVVPLPNEPQGEAIAWEPDGTLLSASEGSRQRIRAIPAVASAVVPRDTPGSDPSRSTPEQAPRGDPSGGNAIESSERTTPSTGQAVLLSGGVAALVLVLAGVVRRRSK